VPAELAETIRATLRPSIPGERPAAAAQPAHAVQLPGDAPAKVEPSSTTAAAMIVQIREMLSGAPDGQSSTVLASAPGLRAMTAPAGRQMAELAQLSAANPVEELAALTLSSFDAAVAPSLAATGPLSTPLAPMQGNAAALPGDAALRASSAEATLGFQLDAARHGEALDAITRDIVASGSGAAKLSFRLDPERLGPMMVELNRQQDGISVRLDARDESTRTLIAEQQPKLIADARAAGVQITDASAGSRRQDTAPQSGPVRAKAALNGQGSAGSQAGQQQHAGDQRAEGPGLEPRRQGCRSPLDLSPSAGPRQLYA
jgi:flagellar hook-length control protein FliK